MNYKRSVVGLAFAAIAAVLIAGSPTVGAQERQANSSNGNIENGKRLFTSENCSRCHGSDAQGGSGQIQAPRIGPPGISFLTFVSTVREPMKPMPPYSAQAISDAGLADLYAFLSSLATPPTADAVPSGDAEKGKRVYMADGCYECHNTEGQGGGGGPKLAPNPIGFPAFAHQLRAPARQMPPYASTVLSDQELADIYAFLRSRPEPPKPDAIPLLN